MEKVGLSKLVEFRRIEKQNSKLTFIKNLSKPKPENDGSGGDYWICSTSASAATYWNKDKSYLENKIEELIEKIKATDYKQTKDQFQKNIDIIVGMQEFDFESIIPDQELEKESIKDNIISIENLPIQVRPQHIFSYKVDEEDQIGGIWFVAKKGGYKNSELGMFATALYEYLKKRFSDNFAIDPNYCLVVDVSSANHINYTQILKGEIPEILSLTINDFKKLL